MVSDSKSVEVVYALPLRQLMLRVTWRAGMTARQAVEESGILRRVPELELERLKLGVFSHFVTLDAEIAAGDRVEIYRPLTADPKAMRRKRAEQAKAQVDTLR